MKIIDADELKKQLGVSARFNADVPAWVLGVINGAPQIRCKDCAWYEKGHCTGFEDIAECEHCGRTFVTHPQLEFPANGFCSYFERRKQ